MSVKQEAVLDVEKLVSGGLGLGRVDGKVWMVTGALPGERVRAEPIQDKSSYVLGRAAAVVRASPDRIEPRCPLFGRCGGCQLQHLAYPYQVEWKRRILEEQIVRTARNAADGCVIHPVAPAPSPWGYRSRVEIHLDRGGAVGFLKARSHEVVAASECPIADAGVNAALARLASLPEGLRRRMAGSLDRIEVRGGEAPGLGLVFRAGVRRRRREALCAQVADATGIPAGEGRSSFAQVNSVQNECLRRTVAALLAPRPEDTVVELFCGDGNLSRAWAGRVGRFYGIDGDKEAISAARRLAAPGAEFLASDAVDGLIRLASGGIRVDKVLADPPRSGMKDAVPHLLRLAPARIVYVSCDPASLARDLGMLSESGYRVLEIRPLDMFPQTHHLEAAARLELTPSGSIDPTGPASASTPGLGG